MTRALLALVLVLAPASSVAAQGETQVLANGWSVVSRLRRLTDVNAVACSEDRAYARGWGGGVAAWDGAAWAELPELPGTTRGETYGTQLAATRDGVVVEASGRLAVWDGTGWSIASAGQTSHWGSIGGIAVVTGEVLAVGRGRVLRREGADLRSYDAGTWRELSAIAGTSASDVWTGGQGGTLMHWDGHAWARAASGTEGTIGGLLAVSASDVWAWAGARVGIRRAPQEPALLLHYDGHAWSSVAPPSGGDVLGVASRAGRVWALTSEGVYERAATGWTSVLVPADFGDGYHSLLGLCATRTHLVVAAGLGSIATRAL